MGSDITHIPAQNIEAIWPLIVEDIKGCLNKTRGEHSLEYVYDRLITDTAQLYLVTREDTKQITGTGVAEVIEYPNYKTYNLWLLYGKDFTDVLSKHRDYMREQARQRGCKFFECFVRKGFEPLLKEQGFKTNTINMHIKA